MQKRRASKGGWRGTQTYGSRNGKGRLEAEWLLSRHSHMWKRANFQTYCKHWCCNHSPLTFLTPLSLPQWVFVSHGSSPCKRAVCLCHLWDTKNMFFCFGTRPCPGCDTAGPHLLSPQPHEPEAFLLLVSLSQPGHRCPPAPRLPSRICVSLGFIVQYVPSLLISLHNCCMAAELQKFSAGYSHLLTCYFK